MRPTPLTGVRTILVLGLLSAFGPLSMDLYLPGLPGLTADFDASRATGQITMSACMIGIAAGQLVVGPLSDRWGRRLPLRLGIGLFALSSLLCAAAPAIGLLIVVRFVQGFAGGAGIVVARAMVRDLYHVDATAHAYSYLQAVTSTVPIMSPLLGAGLLQVTDWRGLFLALFIIGLALLVMAGTLTESLAPAHRTVASGSTTRAQFGALLRDGPYRAYCLTLGLSQTCLFTYIMMSPFVLEEEHRFSVQRFAVVFAVNGLGIVSASRLNAVLLRRFPPRRLLWAGLLISIFAAGSMCVITLIDAPFAAYLVALFVVVSCVGLIAPNVMALAMRGHAGRAGTASGLLGMTKFGIGALIVPVASIAGVSSRSMALTMLVVLLCSVAVLATARQPLRVAP